ncbi:MAG: cell division protein FtsL [Alteromonadaceae bacterium]
MANSKMSLPLDVLHDIQRHIFIYLLLIMVVISAFSVIYFTHLNRQTTSGLEVLLTERDELDIEWRNLVLEQNSLAEHSTIETKARKLLQMKRPNINSEVIINQQ